MAKPPASSSSKTSKFVAPWTASSFTALLELKPILQDVFFNPTKDSRKPTVQFVEALGAGIGDSDREARKLVKQWSDLAFASTDMLGILRQSAEIEERVCHLAFFKTHKELLIGSIPKAVEQLNASRSRLKLGELKRTEKNFKMCMTLPNISKRSAGPGTIASSANPTPQEQLSTPLESPNDTFSDPEPATKLPKAKRPKQSTDPSPNVPAQSAQTGKGQKSRRTLRVPSSKKPDLRSQVELEAYPTPLSFKDVPLPPLPIETCATSSVPDDDTALPQENVTQSTHRPKQKRKEKKYRKKRETATATLPAPKTEDKDIEDVLNLAVDSQMTEFERRREAKTRRDNLRVEAHSSRIKLEQSKEAENGEGLLAINADTAPNNLTPPLSPKSHEEMDLDLHPSPQGDVQLEPTTASQRSPLSLPGDLLPSLQLSRAGPGPEIERILEPTFELGVEFEAKPTVEPVVEVETEPGYEPQLETSAETQARPQVNAQVQAPTLDLVDPYPQDKKIPVWTVSRQELCELPYFKSMQGGVYTRAGTVYGYLLGRFPSPRDMWCHDGRLIISHGGGKNVADEGEVNPNDIGALSKAKHQLGGDQLESDKSVRALLTSYRMFRPIVILAEADYEPLLKFDLKQGHAKEANYYVLGHYAIVAAWAEKEEVSVQGESSLHTRWKFAFQYIEKDQGPPWWTRLPGTPFHAPEPPIATPESQDTPQRAFGRNIRSNRLKVSEVDVDAFPSPAIRQRCSQCNTSSAKVYLIDWMCLNADCDSFWMRTNSEPIPQEKLEFDPNFLHLRSLPQPLETVPYSIVPEYPSWQCGTNGESIFNRQFWAGVCCHRCGRVSCRQKWQYWECPSCKLRLDPSRPQIYPSSSLIDPMYCEAYGSSRFNPGELSTRQRTIRYPNNEQRVVIYYKLPGDAGQLVHVLNNPEASQVPDQLLEQYQTDARDTDMFHRHAIKTHGVKGELYAQHFSYNAGVPYKYIAEAVSTPFDKCPQSVVGARDHIKYLCKSALDREVDFNEVLSVAYAEGQEMNFHSDDEPGLGPVVAGLTLGSQAEMFFRHYVQCKKNLIYKNGPYRASEAYTVDGQNERILQVTLSHGDLLIMDGEKIQMQYEHAVFVRDNDLLRFAATARSIRAPPPMADHPVDPNLETTAYPHNPIVPEGTPIPSSVSGASHFGPPFNPSECIQYAHPFALHT